METAVAAVLVAVIGGPLMWMLHRLDRRNSDQHRDNQAVLVDIRTDLRDVHDDVRAVKADVRELRATDRHLGDRLDRLEQGDTE